MIFSFKDIGPQWHKEEISLQFSFHFYKHLTFFFEFRRLYIRAVYITPVIECNTYETNISKYLFILMLTYDRDMANYGTRINNKRKVIVS